MRIALSIAGSDPTGGAGIQADLQVFGRFGVHGAAVPTALTVQDTGGVHQVLPVFPSVVQAQLQSLLRDLRPHAVKIGMLASDDVLRATQQGLAELGTGGPPLVIDPVLFASDGTPLLERRAWPGLALLCAGARLVTPNRPEATALTGEDASTHAGAERAARALVEQCGSEAVLVTGGHAEDSADDCLAQRDAQGLHITWFRGERVGATARREGRPQCKAMQVHGTGCALSAAVAAALAQGRELPEAVQSARNFVRAGIKAAFKAGRGAYLLGIQHAGGTRDG